MHWPFGGKLVENAFPKFHKSFGEWSPTHPLVRRLAVYATRSDGEQPARVLNEPGHDWMLIWHAFANVPLEA